MPLSIPHSRIAAFVALLLASVLLPGSSTSAEAAVGSDDFRAGQVYRGDFPDPSVTRVGSRYYAFSTNTGGKLLPAMTSTDLRTWRARPAASGRWWQNDALAAPPRWARRHFGNGKWRVSTWAPSVAKVKGGYVAAYAAAVSTSPRRMCVSLAYAERPLGPFVDRSRRPFVCARGQGSIDPDFHRDKAGRLYLLWKNEGIPRREPTRIWTRQLNATATAPEPRSRPVNLLTTALRWEGNVIENPSMVRTRGRTYLVYSANRYSTSAYATGYAVCRSATGPCRRPSRRPLLATGGSVAGPGGADLFLDGGGRLRMAYAAWDRGRVGYPRTAACRQRAAGCNQRKLHVARLAFTPSGRLRVVDRG